MGSYILGAAHAWARWIVQAKQRRIVVMEMANRPRRSASDAIPRVALIAHDARKEDLTEWAAFNRGTLGRCALIGTGTTGARVAEATGLNVELLLSGPLGGDAQVGALLVEQQLDLIVFFWDPLSSQPHDVDVKALLRLAVLYNVPIACNRATADFLISSPLFADAAQLRERRAAASLPV